MDQVKIVSEDVIDDLSKKYEEKLDLTSNTTAPNDSKAIAIGNSQTANETMINCPPQINKPTLCSSYDHEYFLNGFMLVVGIHDVHMDNIIQNSCNFCGMKEPAYKIKKPPGHLFICGLYIQNQLIAIGKGISTKRAQLDVSTKAFDILKTKYFTLMEKKSDEIVSRNSFLILNNNSMIKNLISLPSPVAIPNVREDNNRQTKSTDDNNSNSLQITTGLNDGGSKLGKVGEKRKESIKAVRFQKNLKVGAGTTEVVGHHVEQEINPTLKVAIKNRLIIFLKGPKTRLEFSSEFSKEECIYIRRVCAKLGLRSKIYGNTTDKHVTVRKKQSAKDLFDYLINNGYENDQYRLIPPHE